MPMIEERAFNEIYSDVMIARETHTLLVWTPEEIAIDMLVVTKQITIDLEKYLSTRMTAPAKRVRLDSKILETLGKSFRVQSVKSH
jgi:hypothetical protein